MKLTQFKKYPYTATEMCLFDALPRSGKRVGSGHLAAAREKQGNWDITFPLKTVTVTMTRLIEKVDANREEFRICKEGKYQGHPEVEYWLEPRGVKRRQPLAARSRA
jgi:hypothetical protein